MSESNEMVTLRQMAWERAKGELRAILHTYWGNNDQFHGVSKKINAFIDDLDDNELG